MKKGFTLVELLAVIAILAILVIIALPNVMGMFNTAKENSFRTEVKEVFKTAQQQWIQDSMYSTGEQEYSRCSTCSGKSLSLSGRSELEYYIRLNKAGKVVEYYATDGTFQYSFNDPDGLEIEKINNVQKVAEITNPNDVIHIDSNSGSNSNTTSVFNVGDYIYYKPTKTSYTLDSNLTGYSGNQTINPSLLEVWRVIKKNDDGSVDMISEYVSPESFYINGKKGFLNYVGCLNDVAKQYETPGITIGSRNPGFNGQTESITDTSKITSSVPWGCNTGETCSNSPVESQGGGDQLSSVDKSLINSVYGSVLAKREGQGYNSDYWISSRWYSNDSWGNVELYWGVSLSNSSYPLYYYVSTDGGWKSAFGISGIRPIVTLPAYIDYSSGNGTLNSPYDLNIEA